MLAESTNLPSFEILITTPENNYGIVPGGTTNDDVRKGELNWYVGYQQGGASPDVHDGKYIYYWENGQIHIPGQYDKMKRIGTWSTFDPDGNLILEENYDSLEKNIQNLLEA